MSIDRLGVSITLGGDRNANVIDNVSLNLQRGESLGIAGESGSGKTTLLLAMMGIIRTPLRQTSGSVRFDGRVISHQDDQNLQDIRGGRIALIPQNAAMAMTPTIRVGGQIDEALRLHTSLSRADRAQRVIELMTLVRLPEPEQLARRFPHELSGGQIQRAAIAMALAGDPQLLLMDEPTTGLDVTTQLALLELMIELRQERGLAIVCVSHDLGVLAKLCQRVAVMYSGSLVEEGPTGRVFASPRHPYTRALLRSLPSIHSAGLPEPIDGAPPPPHLYPAGCRFAPRCQRATEHCHQHSPALAPMGKDRDAACFNPVPEDAPAHPTDDQRAQPDDRSGRILQLDGVSLSYGRSHWLGKMIGRRPTEVVEDLGISLNASEILALVGESGSGKSTVLRAIAGIHVPDKGTISLMDSAGNARVLPPKIASRSIADLKAIQLVFQNPQSSLNPRHTVLQLLSQPLSLYENLTAAERLERAGELLDEVRLDRSYLSRLPSSLSGGERQRVAIARAFAARPDVLLCDEITTALDVSVQAAVLRLVTELARAKNVATIFVSHDLAVVRAVAHRIAVLQDGKVVEIGSAEQVCENPAHSYTRSLIGAALDAV